ncbi:TetR family transcriptional regulator [Sinobacterium caligoides]|uniref:TetR family transcriptional regulator n=1 Tax=Sinobacterium caligoides TaxID=933926 RepID=A0A3N2DYE9_9GAMM|nr:TetR/AcrR family transcriptional regulator [Sinobacterium caligoides]ROS04848.1 TetR family transcriptional regulator [Sinobacterium caligoides]
MSQTFKNKSEQKAQQILQAAEQLFCDQGFNNVSMDTVAKAAGVSKQTIYSHYGTKNDLFTAAVTAKCEIYQINDEIFSQQRPLRDTLLDFCQRFHAMITSSEAIAIVRTCAAQAHSHPELGALLYEAGPAKVSQLLQDFLRLQHETGKLQVDNVEDASFQLLLMTQSACKVQLDCGLEPPIPDNERYLQSCVDMFLSYYQR